jgi:hypothetical protein
MTNMKKLLTVLMITLASTAYAAEEKQVCHGRVGKDGKPVVGKDGKPTQYCKKIKVNKKLEGTEVPTKK